MSSIVEDKKQASTSEENVKNIIEVKGVNKIYSSSTIALQDVNLNIKEKEFVSFVGPSGCGKSTLMRIIAGLGDVTSGHVSVLGTTPQIARQQKGEVAFVFQEATLLPWRNIMRNVGLPLEISGVPSKERIQRGERVLELVGLKDHMYAMPNELSGGMKMRVSIARALIANPKLLIMDEPFGALDEITRQNLQHELLDIWKQEELTVLFVTHNVFESVYLSNRTVVMTPRPGEIASVVDVDLPHPRHDDLRTSQRYGELVAQVSESLKH
ncbi:MAG TPA: ABC transporter ATP-binding protein [Bacillota bacterium]|nr:ABC transporter ATP-binding protein [Bacillota bacterium]